MLAGGLQTTIAGPPTLSVANTEVDEGSDVTLDFAVSFEPGAHETVTVRYRPQMALQVRERTTPIQAAHSPSP